MIYKYKTSPVYENWREDKELLKAIEIMPDEYWVWVIQEDLVSLSFEKQKWFLKIYKDEIKKPNIEFCNLIKKLFTK